MSKYDFIDDIEEPEDPSSPALPPAVPAPSFSQEVSAIAQGIPEHAAAAGLNALQAPTLGWADELMNMTGLSGVEDFRQQHNQQYPLAGTLAELSGGLATGAATGPSILSRTSQLGSPPMRAAANVGTAGAAGTAYGLGAGEGSFEERLPGGLVEGGIAAGAGPTGYFAGRLGSTIADPVMEYGGRLFRSDDQQAATMLGRNRSNAGVPTDPGYDQAAREELIPNIPGRSADDLNRMITNADIDPAAAQQLKEIYDQRPESRSGIEDFLRDRQRSASRRTVEDISDITGVDRDSNKALNDLAERANKRAAQLGYDELYNSRVAVDGDLGEMFLGAEGDDLRTAYKKAAAIAAREGDPIPPYGQVFGEDGTLESIPLKAVDYMQRFFRKAGKPNQDPEWDHLSWRRLRERFLSAVDEQVPEFRDVRANYATYKSAEDAMNEGRNIYKLGDARDVEDYFSTLSDIEQASFRRGAIDAVESRLRNARVKSGNVDTHMQGTANQEDLLRLVFGENHDEVTKVLAREDAFNQTYGQVLGGSPTTKNLGSGKLFDTVETRGEGALDMAVKTARNAAGRTFGTAPSDQAFKAMVRQIMSDGYTEDQAKRMARASIADEMAQKFGRSVAGASVMTAPGVLSDMFGGNDGTSR